MDILFTPMFFGYSSDFSKTALDQVITSYQLGYNAFLLGKPLKRPSGSSDVFDRESWLKGWKDSFRASCIA